MGEKRQDRQQFPCQSGCVKNPKLAEMKPVRVEAERSIKNAVLTINKNDMQVDYPTEAPISNGLYEVVTSMGREFKAQYFFGSWLVHFEPFREGETVVKVHLPNPVK